VSKEPRINVDRLREVMVKACYEWRAAEAHHEACILDMGEGIGMAARQVQRAEATLRITIDGLYQEEKSLGLI